MLLTSTRLCVLTGAALLAGGIAFADSRVGSLMPSHAVLKAALFQEQAAPKGDRLMTAWTQAQLGPIVRLPVVRDLSAVRGERRRAAERREGGGEEGGDRHVERVFRGAILILRIAVLHRRLAAVGAEIADGVAIVRARLMAGERAAVDLRRSER